MEPERLANAVVDARARRHPAWATMVGVRGHDHRLAETSRASFELELAEVESLLREAHALAPSLGREALVGMLSLERFELREVRTWARDPDLATQLFDHFFYVMLAGHLTDAEKHASLLARVTGAGAFLREGRARFDAALVPRLWVEGALLSVRAAPEFLDAVRAMGVETPAELTAELDAHVAWLQELHERAKGTPALGGAKFRELLRLRGITTSPEELVKMGESLRVRFAASMEEAARTVLAEAGRHVEAADAVTDALSIVRADHPTSFAEALAEHEAAIADARDLVIARKFATPTDVPLDVIETPSFLRHLIPFAAYVGPARFAPEKRGTYLVTPKADLSAFARADVKNTTVHEAWPGHHLQVSIATERAPLWAWLADAVDLTEGWALYSEAVMGAFGYTASPGERLMREKDARWRAVRVLLDVGLHAEGLDPREAAATLARETGMSPEEADAEVLRYTLAPGYNLSYMYGRVELEGLRDAWLAAGGDERRFHDTLLGLGPLPISLLAGALRDSPALRQA